MQTFTDRHPVIATTGRYVVYLAGACALWAVVALAVSCDAARLAPEQRDALAAADANLAAAEASGDQAAIHEAAQKYREVSDDAATGAAQPWLDLVGAVSPVAKGGLTALLGLLPVGLAFKRSRKHLLTAGAALNPFQGGSINVSEAIIAVGKAYGMLHSEQPPKPAEPPTTPPTA